jgi:glycosyl hydrolase family 92
MFNTSSGYIQPRHSNGRWMDSFDASLTTGTSSNDFAEGDALTYTPDVPFNLAELASLEGGNSALVSYLNNVLSGYQGLASIIGRPGRHPGQVRGRPGRGYLEWDRDPDLLVQRHQCAGPGRWCRTTRCGC